jgi:hypothetical protein
MKVPMALALLALASGLGAPSGALGSPSPTGAGQMVLVRTDRLMPITDDPIWELQLSLPGQPTRSYEALVGRVRRQNGDRSRLGSKAPLPMGHYTVSEIAPVQPSDDPELGRFLWIGLEPTFATARKGLGIHHDPSAGRGRLSGTDGCIGLIHGNDLLVLGDLLRSSGIRDLEVRD